MAFDPAAAQQILNVDSRVFALLRQPARGRPVLCVHNVTNEAIQVTVPILPGRKWRSLFEQDRTNKADTSEMKTRLAPYEVFWVGQES
jgi:hypothetical protein